MADSTNSSSGLAPALVALMAPLADEYSGIIFAALAGALWPLSAQPNISRTAGAMLVLRLVMTAAVFSGVIAWVIEHKFGVPIRLAMSPVAFAIAALGDGWRAVFAAWREALSSIRVGGSSK